MRIDCSATDSVLVNSDGTPSQAIVLQARYQLHKGGKWHQANIISPQADVPTALETMASYLRAQQAAAVTPARAAK